MSKNTGYKNKSLENVELLILINQFNSSTKVHTVNNPKYMYWYIGMRQTEQKSAVTTKKPAKT